MMWFRFLGFPLALLAGFVLTCVLIVALVLVLAYPNLPANLTNIQRELNKIRSELASVGKGELALSSFMWMVKDGLVLSDVRHEPVQA